MAADDTSVTNHAVVSHEEWIAARQALLEREKAFTKLCDEMSLLQRSLPWERVTKDYAFDPKAREREGHSIFYQDAGGRRRDEYGR